MSFLKWRKQNWTYARTAGNLWHYIKYITIPIDPLRFGGFSLVISARAAPLTSSLIKLRWLRSVVMKIHNILINVWLILNNSDAEGGEARAGGGRSWGGGTRRSVSFAHHSLGRQPQPAHQLPPARPWLRGHASTPDTTGGAHRTAEDIWSKSTFYCHYTASTAVYLTTSYSLINECKHVQTQTQRYFTLTNINYCQ